MLTALGRLDEIFRAAWSAETCDPVDLPWSSQNPSSGQCGVTTLVLHDLLGGSLLIADVHVNGEKVGHHYWLRLAGGIEVDLTRERARVFSALGVAPSSA